MSDHAVRAAARMTLGRSTYQATVYEVLSRHPLRTRVYWKCDHRHRKRINAVQCAEAWAAEHGYAVTS